VNYHLTIGSFPVDNNAQYYVFNGDDTKVTSTGSTDDYCGYHSVLTVNNLDIKFGFIVTDKTQLSVCTFADAGPYTQVINSAVTTLAHEIIESVSDPLVGSPGGYQTSGTVASNNGPTYYENGDMCANINFPLTTSSNGKGYTTVVGTHQYLLQSNVNPSDNCCGFPTGVPPPATLTASPVVPTISASPAAASSLVVGSSIPATNVIPGTASNTPASASVTAFPSYVYPSDFGTNTYVYGGLCGNGVIDSGEQCDPGLYSFGGASCCNIFCQWKHPGSFCGKTPQNTPCYKTARCETVKRGSPALHCTGGKIPKLRGAGCRIRNARGRCDGKVHCNPVPT